MSAVRVGDRVRLVSWPVDRAARVLAVRGELVRLEIVELEPYGVEWWVQASELSVIEPLDRFYVGLVNGLLFTGLGTTVVLLLLKLLR